MIYIDKEYLVSHAQERLIDENCQNDTSILDKLEVAQIEIVKSYLGTRYNVGLIFVDGAPIENEVLKDIIAKLLLYRLFKRNAARKVPTDCKEAYDEAMKTLKDVATGVIKLSGVPVAVDESGAIISNSISGNLKNPNFYI